MKALTRDDLPEGQKTKIANEKAMKQARKDAAQAAVLLADKTFSELTGKEKDDLLGMIAVRMGLVKGL
jgi:hypothetical protein